ncbi:hypothetical protein ACI65C_004077 [Semiaphis heraclei]
MDSYRYNKLFVPTTTIIMNVSTHVPHRSSQVHWASTPQCLKSGQTDWLCAYFQWPNSKAEHTEHNISQWEEYLLSSTKNESEVTSVINQDNRTTTMTLSYKENQKNDSVTGIENTGAIVVPTANLTNSSSIVFPSSTDKKIEINKFIPQQDAIEKCSLNESFCIKIDNYPREDLSNLLKTSKFMSNPYYDVDDINEINDFEKRISDELLQSFCQSRTSVIYPEVGLTLQNEWRYIIQNPSNDNSSIKQGILVEKCIDTRVPCTFDSTLPLGYVSTCIQKYLYKRLISIEGTNEFYYDTFKMPSCCQCMYSVNEDLLTRKGKD